MICFSLLIGHIHGASPQTLPNSQALTETGDLSARMREGLHKFLGALTERALTNRAPYWHRNVSSAVAYAQSVETNRLELRRLIGAVDEQPKTIRLELLGMPGQPITIAESELCSAYAVSWTAFRDVHGEGLLLRPKQNTQARVIVLPDADQTPEAWAGLDATELNPVARRLAEAGCEVLVPTLVNREATWSGNRRLNRQTNQPHREWIYRQAFTVGRHILGYEVEKVLAAVDWFSQQPAPMPIGLLGYGEGGAIAFYASALDPRINATLVSGYFKSRQALWSEPIYRNVFGLLREFGDAEIASLIVPRPLFIEHSELPVVPGPASSRSTGAAPGHLQTPEQWSLEGELTRLQEFFPRNATVRPQTRLFNGSEGTPLPPGSKLALLELIRALKLQPASLSSTALSPWKLNWTVDAPERQHRQVQELEEHTQELLREAEDVRTATFWDRLKGTNTTSVRAQLRHDFEEQLVGRVDLPRLGANPRSRLVQETPRWTAYEVTLDVWPDVFAWGLLLLPKTKSGLHPVVVCQHGLEGVPADTINADPASQANRYYQGYAARLAERGYVVFAPHNPYRGGDDFRQLQRRANPLGLSLYSIIVAQHEQIVAWLSAQPFVDPKRIGFYGLSYGGKSALYLPALIDQYALAICSANFNDWARTLADTSNPLGYMFSGEYEMPEFNLANTFSHAELAALIAPRPFMVERGHDDGVARDESVAYEYAKVRRYYDALGWADRTRIEFFSGGHTIHGVGTFEFLDRYLRPNL